MPPSSVQTRVLLSLCFRFAVLLCFRACLALRVDTLAKGPGYLKNETRMAGFAARSSTTSTSNLLRIADPSRDTPEGNARSKTVSEVNFKQRAGSVIAKTLATKYFGIVRVNATATSVINDTNTCQLPKTDFRRLQATFYDPSIQTQLTESDDDSSWERVYDLYMQCGQMGVSVAGQGCVWNVKTLFLNLYQQGTELLRMGAEPKLAYSL
jgi:hypothetical protein